MNDKRKQIIEAALRCFSRKGFQATSIQEIADELGMAKGSLYFYFKSKEELLLSVFAHFAERMLLGMSELPHERQLPPRERLRLQLERSFDSIIQNRQFPLLLMREPLMEMKPELKRIMADIRSRSLRWCRDHIETIYGPEAGPYVWDGAALLNGMMMEYYRVLLVGEPSFNEARLSRFFVSRLDDLMHGLIREKGTPLMGFADLMGVKECGGSEEDLASEHPSAILRELWRLAEAEGKDAQGSESYEDLVSALTLLEEELGKPVPDRVIVRGMVSLLKERASPSRMRLLERLERRTRGPY
ncbi:TetR/AcrR family transcriptional regulator [Cohnella sp. AR92]|uniref:TetR/AcrR family transcriptional regulator n=1 Tax=Cohnella sp. AR92 TaxID=648716 RepID=UPI000F8D305A|nr:TetR/AcrR family transcriptional regulator [Cohnella sp. AR92]RUS46754.1 TetR family transcriptional regulator [Cohnella sp. AR92]